MSSFFDDLATNIEKEVLEMIQPAIKVGIRTSLKDFFLGKGSSKTEPQKTAPRKRSSKRRYGRQPARNSVLNAALALNKPLQKLGLSKTAVDVLKKNNIDSTRKLVTQTESQFSVLPWKGKTRPHVKERLRAHGLKLGMKL